jgi:hypothetical protein
MGSRIPRAGSLEENQFPAIFIGTALDFSFAIGSFSSSAPIGAGVTLLRVAATKNCQIKIGGSPACYLPAGIVEYFGCKEGDILEASGLSEAGFIYANEGSSQWP